MSIEKYKHLYLKYKYKYLTQKGGAGSTGSVSAGPGDESIICTPSGMKKCFANEASVYAKLEITGANEALLKNLFLRQKILDNLPDERIIAHLLLKDSSEDLTDELRTYIDYIVAMAKAALPDYATSRKKFHVSIIDIRINKDHSLFGRSLQKLNRPNGKDKAMDEIYKLVDKFLRAKPSIRILEDYKVLGIQKTFLVREMTIDDPNDVPFKTLQNEIMSLISTPIEVPTDASVDVPVFIKEENGNFIYNTIDGPYAALSYYDYFNNTSRKLHSSMTDLSDSQIAKILQRPDFEFSKILGTDERNEIKRTICENIKAIFSKLDFKNDRWGEFKDSELGAMIAEKGKILANVTVYK